MIQGYAEYKDSGVEWLGEIPTGWATAPIRSHFTESRKKNRKLEDSNYLSLMAGVGVIPYAEKGDVGNKMPEDLSNCKIVTPNDFVLNSMNFGIGSFGRSKYQGICSSVYVILKGLDIMQLSYFERVFQQPLFQKFSQSLGNGILAHRCAIGWDELKNERFPVPPSDEVFAIAAFLDDKVSKIDELVGIKRRQIELLGERKQILIQNAVTKGLNPDAPMKDSVVDWIGEIPVGWEVKRVKHLLSERNERSESGDEPLLMVSQIHGLVVRADYHSKSEVAATSVGNKIVHENDLVFNKLKAHLGVFFKSKIQDVGIVSPDYAVYVPSGVIPDNQFFEILFRHPAYIGQFIIRATGIVEGLIRLYTSELFDIPVAVPSHNEQQEIIKSCALETKKINAGISLKQNQITKLNEYKVTLINAAVTGKIKVA